MRAPLLREHFQDLEKQAHAARLGMWSFLASETLLFAGLFTLYAAYRTMYPADFALAVEHNSRLIGTTNTVILITSSFTVAASLHAVRRGRPRRAGGLLLASIALGLLFLVLKGVEYAQHFREGIYPAAHYHYAELQGFGPRMFYTLYFYLTGLHALHVVVGLIILGWLCARAFGRAYSPESHVHLELGALYWHLIDVVWIFLWPMLYLMDR
jgi:cytochrome c oxidase subunit 3